MGEQRRIFLKYVWGRRSIVPRIRLNRISRGSPGYFGIQPCLCQYLFFSAAFYKMSEVMNLLVSI